MYASAPLSYAGAPISTGKGPVNSAAMSAAQTELVKRIAREKQAKMRAEAQNNTKAASQHTLKILAMEKSLAEISKRTAAPPPPEVVPALQPGQSVAEPPAPVGVATVDATGAHGERTYTTWEKVWHASYGQDSSAKIQRYALRGAVAVGAVVLARKFMRK